MATIKNYTDIEQSKKLAEFLPIESADMRYGYIAPYEYSDRMFDGGYDEIPYPKDFLKRNPNFSEDEYDGSLPCWSLGALISLLPKRYCLETLDNGTYVCYNFLSQYEKFGKTPIDAVYSMIVFLKEEKII